MNHLFNSVRHGVYVWAVAVVGSLVASGANLTSTSTPRDLQLALAPAAAAGAWKLLSAGAPQLAAALLNALAAAAPKAPVVQDDEAAK